MKKTKLKSNAIKRREDKRFLAGRGKYLDDIFFDEEYFAVFVRSPHPHAKIKEIRTTTAKVLPDVVAVLTAEDAAKDGLVSMEPFITHNPNTNQPFNFIAQPLLAENFVRYVGEPVVLIVAKTTYAARDAAELIEIDYNILPFILSATDALKDGSPNVVEALGSNLCLNWYQSNVKNIETIFAEAKYVVELDINNNRIVSNPMEPRGIIASWDQATNKYTIYASSQNIHVMRDVVASMLNVDSKRIRFVASDVGGGFGSKNFCYPEYALVPWAAQKFNKPVRWVATRDELFIADHQARDHNSKSRLA
ncbi:MAG: molybdopterin cofactor-binding domain-containing protein, partial [Pseudomonadota bacterium]|nr:molybdopterin cofactor-binding domain-containing protein [Pseudomonadota bacterium]